MAQANRVRRRHGAEFKQRVLAECDRPGASVATVALSHGVNANLVDGLLHPKPRVLR
ncbi:MAG: transposase [Burkholderiales bacterium]|jgi:transposase|nr:transposase [Burkholderiales bacterium]